MSASAAESNVIRVSNQKEFEEAIARVNKDSDSEYTIELTADFSVNGFSITSPHKTTILGSGHTLTMGVGGSVSVSKGAELTLGSTDGNVLNIRSAEGTSNDVPGMLNIEGTCNMYSGVTLSGREGNNYFGGGVTVSGGTFHMYGGTIEKCGIKGGSVCYGGGVLAVALKSPAAASIENTTVKGNKAAVGAGIASYGYYTNMNIKGVHRHGKYCAKVRRRFFCRKQYGWRKNDDHRYGPVQQHCRYRRIRCVSQKVTISAAVRSQHEFHLSRGAGRCSQSED